MAYKTLNIIVHFDKLLWQELSYVMNGAMAGVELQWLIKFRNETTYIHFYKLITLKTFK